jgi:hypothetical protein
MNPVLLKYLKTVAIVAADFFAAWAVTRRMPRQFAWFRSQTTRIFLFLTGTGALLVAGIGRLGWAIQSWSGQSSSEHLDQGIFFILSVGGTFLLVLDYFLVKDSK